MGTARPRCAHRHEEACARGDAAASAPRTQGKAAKRVPALCVVQQRGSLALVAQRAQLLVRAPAKRVGRERVAEVRYGGRAAVRFAADEAQQVVASSATRHLRQRCAGRVSRASGRWSEAALVVRASRAPPSRRQRSARAQPRSAGRGRRTQRRAGRDTRARERLHTRNEAATSDCVRAHRRRAPTALRAQRTRTRLSKPRTRGAAPCSAYSTSPAGAR